MTADETTPLDWRIIEAPQPATLDDPDAWAYLGMAEIDREINLEAYGYDDLALAPLDILSGMQHQEYDAKRRFVAVRTDASADASGDATRTPTPSDVVGYLFSSLPRSSNQHLGELYTFVRRSARGAGIGSALLALGERLAADAGRTVLYSASQHGVDLPAGPGALDPTTGAGHVPADEPGPRFASHHGYVLEQVERHSVLDLPVAPDLLERFDAESRAVAGSDYRTHTWQDSVPGEWLDQVGLLYTRMSTDPPQGGIDFHEDAWDGQRVQVWLDQIVEKGHGVADHGGRARPDGDARRLHGLRLPRRPARFAFQEDTIVLEEHRGHRLGHAPEVREPRAARRGPAGHPAHPHMERRGERPHARHQHGAGLRAGRRVRELAEAGGDVSHLAGMDAGPTPWRIVEVPRASSLDAPGGVGRPRNRPRR